MQHVNVLHHIFRILVPDVAFFLVHLQALTVPDYLPVNLTDFTGTQVHIHFLQVDTLVPML